MEKDQESKASRNYPQFRGATKIKVRIRGVCLAVPGDCSISLGCEPILDDGGLGWFY